MPGRRPSADALGSLTALKAACYERDKRIDAWLYGVFCGWGDALDEVARKHGWDSDGVERLKRYHAAVEVTMEKTE